MLSIRFMTSSSAIERYLNKKAEKGYIIQSIVPFSLFVPLEFIAYKFKKSTNKNRIYRVDSRNVSKEEAQEYYQLFEDDGWTSFNMNSYDPSQHIFYSDDPTKENIFSDDASVIQRDRNDAISNLLKGVFLFCCFLFLSLFFPISNGNTNTIVGFLSHNFYIIVASLTIIVSLFRYWSSRHS